MQKYQVKGGAEGGLRWERREEWGEQTQRHDSPQSHVWRHHQVWYEDQSGHSSVLMCLSSTLSCCFCGIGAAAVKPPESLFHFIGASIPVLVSLCQWAAVLCMNEFILWGMWTVLQCKTAWLLHLCCLDFSLLVTVIYVFRTLAIFVWLWFTISHSGL